MPRQIALIRGINVGGRQLVRMADLRALLERLGFAEPQSILQSGNLVFTGDRRSAVTLEKLLERETTARLKLDVDFIIRSAKDLRTVVDRNPFLREARDDPGHLVVMFLKSVPTGDAVAALQATIKGRETVHADGRHLYVVYPDGIGRSKLTGNVIEKKLGTRGTARNWNTVQRLLAACE